MNKVEAMKFSCCTCDKDGKNLALFSVEMIDYAPEYQTGFDKL